MKLEHSETFQCLVNAFAGESQVRNRYTFFAKIAKQEGYEQISQIFLDTAENEKEHAKLFYKHIPNAEHLTVTGTYPFFYGDTYENLKAAASGEREEWEILYKNSAQVAKDDGFDDIYRLFNNIVEIEKHHSHRFELLAEELKAETVFKNEEVTQWICRTCAHLHIAKEAPCKCPVCEHPQGYFQVFVEKY